MNRKCIKCSTKMELCRGAIYTSFPMKEKYKCAKCGYIDYFTINEELPDLKKLFEGIINEDNFNEIKGKKNDEGKRRYDLLPFSSLDAVVDVLTFGNKKYPGKENWKLLSDPKDRYFAAAMRHMSKWKQGEKLDSETNINHLAHGITNLLFLIYFDEQD